MAYDFCKDITSRLSSEGEINVSSLKNTDADFHNVDVSGIMVSSAGSTGKISVQSPWNNKDWVLLELENGSIHEVRISKIRSTGQTATQVVLFGVGR
jgi:hypothetical protein